MAKVNIVTVGGCGQNVGSDVIKHLKTNKLTNDVVGYRLYSSEEVVSDATSFDPTCFDTTYRFKSSDIGGKELKGSGGDRKENFPHYVEGVKDFMNTLKGKPLHKAMTGDAINVVIFSGSKGTGSTAGPILMKYLLEANIPFFSVLVVDNTDELTIINCVNTIESINGVAKNTRSNPLVYIGENNVDGKGELDINEDVCAVVEAMALLGLGKVNGLDEADYNTFVDVRKYTKLHFEPAMMVLSAINSNKDEYGNDIPIKLNTNLKPAVARYIVNAQGDSHATVKSKHAPTGVISNDSLILNTPLVLANCFGAQYYVSRLDEAYEDIEVDTGVQTLNSNIGDKVKAEKAKNDARAKELEAEAEQAKALQSLDNDDSSTDDDDDEEWHEGFIL